MMAVWTYAGSPADGLRWTQRAVAVLGADAVTILRALDASGIVAAIDRLRALAAERTGKAKAAALAGVDVDDYEAIRDALHAAADVLPAEIADVILARIASPEAVDLLLALASMCAVDGHRFDPEAPSTMTLRQIAAGVLGVAREQGLFR